MLKQKEAQEATGFDENKLPDPHATDRPRVVVFADSHTVLGKPAVQDQPEKSDFDGKTIFI